MRVLVVEDEPLLADAIAEWLRGDAHAVDIALDGAAALERLDVFDYDVLVLDRDLPVVHGDEVCRRIVASGSGPRMRGGSGWKRCWGRWCVDGDGDEGAAGARMAALRDTARRHRRDGRCRGGAELRGGGQRLPGSGWLGHPVAHERISWVRQQCHRNRPMRRSCSEP